MTSGASRPAGGTAGLGQPRAPGAAGRPDAQPPPRHLPGTGVPDATALAAMTRNGATFARAQPSVRSWASPVPRRDVNAAAGQVVAPALATNDVGGGAAALAREWASGDRGGCDRPHPHPHAGAGAPEPCPNCVNQTGSDQGTRAPDPHITALRLIGSIKERENPPGERIQRAPGVWIQERPDGQTPPTREVARLQEARRPSLWTERNKLDMTAHPPTRRLPLARRSRSALGRAGGGR